MVRRKWYEIHVRGELPDDVLVELGGLQVSVEEPQTVLRGSIRDQAALHGILLRLHGRLCCIERCRVILTARSSVDQCPGRV